MWSIAVFDYRISSDEFWRLTPAQFYALTKKWEQQRHTNDLYAGQIICWMRNLWRGKRSRPVKLEECMPTYDKKSNKRKMRDLKAEWDLVMVPQQNAIMKVRGR
jgi:hypothetical protein